MLRRLKITGFKSLVDVEVRLPRLVVIFGPNACGKSNLLDAIQLLSRFAGTRTLADALAEPIRGHPVEAFTFPPDGLSGLLRRDRASFKMEAELEARKKTYRYRLEVELRTRSGALAVADEYLAALNKQGEPKGTAAIEVVEGNIRLRRRSQRGKPRYERLGQNFTMLSDPRLSGLEYNDIELVRNEMSGWETYYLDPRVSMRSAKTPSEVQDIGVTGGDLAPFLYRLKAEHPERFDAIIRTMRSLIPSVDSMDVDLDERRGTLDIMIRQDGVEYSSRVISEGTLRVLALCAVAVNPWCGSLLALEEPENGVHPRRIELIAQLLFSLATERHRQVVISTHSPLFCDVVLKLAKDRPEDVILFNVHRRNNATVVTPFELPGPLFSDSQLASALTASAEDGLFESLVLRGLIDE